MNAQGAEPGELAGELRDGTIISGNATLSQFSLPASVVLTLAAENIRSLEAWRALGRRRYAIFGITRRVAEQLDALAKGRP